MLVCRCLVSWNSAYEMVSMKCDHERTDVANDGESGGEVVLFGFWEYGAHYVIWSR